jgi:acetyl esterase/lipase
MFVPNLHRTVLSTALVVLLLATGVASLVQGATPAVDSIEVVADIDYAGSGNPRQQLDLYLPKMRSSAAPLPVIVFVHGGGWVGGTKGAGRVIVQPYAATGSYAGVSIGYRLASEARWPAQIHDCKAAIRWIRANAARHGLDPERIGVIGSSAGGTLVTLLGVSGGVEDLEGSVGPHGSASSRVACVVNRFGRLNFLAQPESARASPAQAGPLAQRLALMFGGPVDEKAGLARRASPVSHAAAGLPPIITFHGTADTLVPFVQAEEFDAAMRRAGGAHLLVPVQGGGHGYENAEERRRVRQFFDQHLRGIPSSISTEPIPHPVKR